MRHLKRTGVTGRTQVGYARRGTIAIMGDKDAERALKEGGWEEVTGPVRMTEVPDPTKAAGTAQSDAKDDGGSQSTGDDAGGQETPSDSKGEKAGEKGKGKGKK